MRNVLRSLLHGLARAVLAAPMATLRALFPILRHPVAACLIAAIILLATMALSKAQEAHTLMRPLQAWLDEHDEAGTGYVHLVVDFSGSMQGPAWAEAKCQTIACAAMLPDGWQLTATAYCDTLEVYSSSWRVKSRAEVVALSGWLDFLRPYGGTDAAPALGIVHAMPPGEGVPVLAVLITDFCLNTRDFGLLLDLLEGPWREHYRSLLLVQIDTGMRCHDHYGVALQLLRAAERVDYELGAQLQVVTGGGP